jgi:hypothetical protein
MGFAQLPWSTAPHKVDSALNLPVFGMDDGVPESAAVQGSAGPYQRSGTHHRNRHRLIPIAADDGGEEEALSREEPGFAEFLPPWRPLRLKGAALRATPGSGGKNHSPLEIGETKGIQAGPSARSRGDGPRA